MKTDDDSLAHLPRLEADLQAMSAMGRSHYYCAPHGRGHGRHEAAATWLHPLMAVRTLAACGQQRSQRADMS